MAYTMEKPRLVPSAEVLRRRIPGWGVDVDPTDRPAVPKLNLNREATGAHWDFPERQPEKRPREQASTHRAGREQHQESERHGPHDYGDVFVALPARAHHVNQHPERRKADAHGRCKDRGPSK